MSDDQLGPLVRLWGLTTAQLPDPSETPDNLAPFLISILQEAVPFIDSVAPKLATPAPPDQADPDPAAATALAAVAATAAKAWKPKGSKAYPESAAKVHLAERVVDSSELERVAGRSVVPPSARLRHDARLPAETWICRRSVHADSAAEGARSASWAEFRDAVKDRHAESEEAFTPSVVGARAAVVWDCGGAEAVEGGETWGKFTLRVEEVRHRIGKPVMKDRVFPVLQMTCSAMETNRAVEAGDDAAAVSRDEKPEFLVVSITVTDFGSASPAAEFSKGKGVVVGAYTSVERIRKLPGSGEIEWIMATASDARGVLPMWVQTMAVPGQIARDVPLFLSWIAKERKGDGGAGGAAAAPAVAAPPPASEPPAEVAEAAPAAGEEAKGQSAGTPTTTSPPPPPKDEPSAEPPPAPSAPTETTPPAPNAEGEGKAANGEAKAEDLGEVAAAVPATETTK